MRVVTSVRCKAGSLLAVICLALTGCFMTPGKFTAELALTGDDGFTFTYDGEIFFAGLSRLAQMSAAEEAFAPSECHDAETYETRACTPAEVAEQRKVWDEAAPGRAAERKKQAEQMAALMGGIDPSDPKAADELVRLLLRHRGWEQAESLGNGLFRVRYRIGGTLGHDFMFPAIEGFPATNPFVQTFARKSGEVRINAPGFAVQGGDNGMAGMMGGFGAVAGLGGMGPGSGASPMADFPAPDGTFTIRTTAAMRVRANNTEDGPERTPEGEVLAWRITPRTTQMPTALIDLTR
jgi:hypothetical protein